MLDAERGIRTASRARCTVDRGPDDRHVGGDRDHGGVAAPREEPDRVREVEATLVDTGFQVMSHQVTSYLATDEPPRRTAQRLRLRPRTRRFGPPTDRS